MRRPNQVPDIDPALVGRVHASPRDFPEVIVGLTEQLLPEGASMDERLFMMCAVRDRLTALVKERKAVVTNMTAAVSPQRSPYFVQ